MRNVEAKVAGNPNRRESLMETLQKRTLIGAIREYFDLSIFEARVEFAKLTNRDKADLREYFLSIKIPMI
jgi:hypothetical protein